MTPAGVHLDLASWVLAATFVLFVVILAAAIVSSWRDSRRPPRKPGVFEAVFALRHARLIGDDEAQDILGRYDETVAPKRVLERRGRELW